MKVNFTITKGIDSTKGIKTVIYGVEGVGKTLLASQFPDPVFIDTEGSTTHYGHIAKFTAPKDWNELNEMVRFVSEKKPCKTLVIDTFDWAEQAEVEGMLTENKWTSIEAAGYGKGYVLSAERIARFLKNLERLLIDKGINVVLTCHSQIRKIELPEEQGSYDKYELKLGNKTGSRTAPLVKEWADMILFCNFKTYVETKTDGFGNVKGKATGGKRRVMYATRDAAWDAKNRFGLPEEMDLSFKPLEKIFFKPKVIQPKPKEAVLVEESPKQESLAEKDSAQDSTAEESQATPQEDPLPALTWPESVPQEAQDLCMKEGFYPEDVQRMIFDQGIVKKLDFPLSKIPTNFWTSFVKDFETKWQEPMEQARRDNLPF